MPVEIDRVSSKVVIHRAGSDTAPVVVPLRGSMQVPVPVDNAVAQLLVDPSTASGAELAALLEAKITDPDGGTPGVSVLLLDDDGTPIWGTPLGVVTMNLDGTLRTILTPPTGTQTVVLEAGGFMNVIDGPDPAYAAQVGAPLELGGDVYGAYASLNSADSWIGSNDGVTDVKHMKTITIFKSKTTPNESYRYTSNWNLTNSSAVVSCLWKHTYDPAAKRVTATLLFDTAGSTSLGAQANLYRAMGDGSSHPRQTGNLGLADPLVAGRGWLAHGDGVVQFTEAGGVVLKALNGAATKNQCSGLDMDPVKDPTTGIDLYVTVANGTDAGVWKIANAQLPGIAGSVGGPTATKLTGGAAPFQPMGIRAVNLSGTTHLLVTDAGLPSNPGGIRHWNGTTWSNITPTGAPTASSGCPGYAGGLAYPATVPSPVGGTSNSGVIVYKAIDAVVVGGTIRCVVGHDGPDQNNTSKMMWTDDALTASGWHFHVDADNQANYPEKGSGKLFWLANAPNGAPYSYFAMRYGSAGWDCSDIHIDRVDPTKCYASGRSGLWYFSLTGAANAQPANNGMGAAISIANAFHPTNPNIALAGDSDWTCLHWTDLNAEPRLVQHTSGSVALPNNVDGREVRFDVNGFGYVGQAQRSTFDNGDIWTTPDTTTAAAWYSLMHGNNPGLSAWTDFGVRGLVAVKHTDGDMVVLAFIGPKISGGDPTHAGIWRLKGTWNNTTHAFEIGGVAQTWTRVSSTFSTFTSQFQFVRSSAGRNTSDAANSFAYDPVSAGLVRSLDYGATWASIFPRTWRAIYRYAGAVKCDKLVPNRVWVTIPGTASSLGEVWRIDNAHDGTLSSAGATLTGTITATKVNVGTTGAALDCPGQLVVKTDGTVIVHQGVSGAVGHQRPGLFASSDGGATWADIATADFRGVGAFVYAMSISADDQTLLVSTDGNGAFKIPLVPTSTAIDWYTKAEVDNGFQPKDSDLTTIAGLTPATGDTLQYTAGAWANRTGAQARAALAAVGRTQNLQTVTLTPSATANTDGTPVAYTLHAGVAGINVTRYSSSFAGIVASEQLTITFTVTFDDATTKTATLTSATGVNTAQSDTAIGMQNFYKDGHYVTGITAKVKSTATSSVATATPMILGLDL